MNSLRSSFRTAQLAQLPTPVVPLIHLGEKTGNNRLFMKRDDLSGSIYGGNKIRKLEFLLGEAVSEGRKSVITYGAAGSNHALATAICCRELELRPISILAPQETSSHVRKNILMQQAIGAELHLCSSYTDFPETTQKIAKRCTQEDGVEPYIIPSGGTNAIGALGFVNAALELAEQIKPDVIYLPMGTGGTFAGLLVGLKLTGLKTRIEAIRVVDPAFRNAIHIKNICDELCKKMGKTDQVINKNDITIRDDFFGDGYGIPTPEAEEAVLQFKSLENIHLETTYTGKTVAALLHDLKSGRLEGQTVLYWNTLNSHDFSADIADLDFHSLPIEFHPYFS